jgi:drug/metabolite transporter (DMT)-like permease
VNKWLKYTLLGVLALIWGSSFVMMKEGLKSFTAMQVATYRIFSAGIILLPLVIRQIRKLEKADIKYAIVSGFVGNALPAFLFAYAQTQVNSSLTGSLNSLTPLFTMLFSVLVFNIAVTRRQVIGIFIGLIGAITLILAKSVSSDEETNYLYTLPIILATILYGLNVNLIKAKLSKYPPLTVTTIPLASISIFAFFMLFMTGIPDFSGPADPQMYRSLGSVLVLGVFGTALALLLFNRLLQMSSPVFASSVTYLIPIVAMVAGFWQGERIFAGHIVGLVFILFGIYLVNRKKKQKL